MIIYLNNINCESDSLIVVDVSRSSDKSLIEYKDKQYVDDYNFS